MQTDDRQTDGRAIAYSEREHKFTFAKNSKTIADISAKVERRIDRVK